MTRSGGDEGGEGVEGYIGVRGSNGERSEEKDQGVREKKMGLARITGPRDDRPASFWSFAKRNPPLSIPDAASNPPFQHMRIPVKST